MTQELRIHIYYVDDKRIANIRINGLTTCTEYCNIGYDAFIMYIFQDYIARFGHGSAKLAKQAQSKEKVLAKMVASGLTEKVVTDKVIVVSI